MLRKMDREKELRILTTNIIAWLRESLGRDFLEIAPRTDEDEDSLAAREEKRLWQELRRGGVIKEVLLKADDELNLRLQKANTPFHHQENLQSILNVCNDAF